MVYKVAINGFGRIGRMVLRALVESGRDEFEVVAINDLAPASRLGHLLKYDSVHGAFPKAVEVSDETITVDGQPIKVFSERDPAALPWAEHKIDIVMECTGFFLTRETAGKHITAGAKRVLLSAPAKDDTKTIVFGVNDGEINGDDVIVSNASCTTNALAPVLKVLDDSFGVEGGMMTTIHAYTGDQPTHDGTHKDPYRGRAAALSMIPTSTGAAKAIGKVLPHLDGTLSGVAVRVPVANVSMVDLSVTTKRPASVETVQKAFKVESEGRSNGVLGYIDEALVSTDLNHNPNSSNFVEDQTLVQGGHLVRIMSWYDNEWGFSNRMLDTASVMVNFL